MSCSVKMYYFWKDDFLSSLLRSSICSVYERSSWVFLLVCLHPLPILCVGSKLIHINQRNKNANLKENLQKYSAAPLKKNNSVYGAVV